MKKYICLILLIILITGCKSKSIDINECHDCVFAYDEKGKQITSDDTIDEYKKDYKDLTTKDGKQRSVFLGYMLDGKNIKRGFACGILNGKVFCLEGTTDGSTYDKNVEILLDVYGEEKCTEFDDYIYCKDEVAAGAGKMGSASTSIYDDVNCVVENNGSMYCE